MGKLKGFLQYPREGAHYRPVKERLSDYREVEVHPDEEKIRTQGARCMECGTPFCHSLGCPLGNLIPEVNDAAAAGLWREAYERLELTNNFPEVTGRICPALCEASCTLSINDAPVTIRSIEYSVTEHAFREGWVVPRPPKAESGKRTAVIGSGPAGLSAAQQLRRAGHKVTVFEKSDRIGGLLRYGIPNFKLDKGVLERRLAIIASEGVEFETGVNAGKDISTAYLLRKFDAVLIATGAGMPRDIAVPGRELQGIHFALDYLTEANRWASDGSVPGIRADGKNVLVLGGGDTGSDCVGTARRQGADNIYQFEILQELPKQDGYSNPSWPEWPRILRTSSSHEEGCERRFSTTVLRFEGSCGKIEKTIYADVEWKQNSKTGALEMAVIPGSEKSVQTDLVLLAMGFTHTEHSSLLHDFGVTLDGRGNIQERDYQTNVPQVFACGDCSTGASIVVRAIAHGRSAAESVDRFLKGL